ncbi:MAG: ABC transporter ATP-binding protein [Spirochaetaceae bacterium]|jgi:oligopeptide transport system ATP-binding protein|nr:ABC transporter ATP-binding protein [Spirochaetaceae bacterium]
MNTLLEVQNLTVSFFTPVGEVKAVGGISYSLDYGEVMGIVGESGSGKSVEAYALLGILEAPGKVTGGSVRFEGTELLEQDRREMEKLRGAKLSMIFQNPMDSLNPVYTIGSQLTGVLRKHKPGISSKDARARALEMLTLVGITNPRRRMRQHPHELSGGMRQRVMIAMALICEPQLLIADEPTTALDVTIQAQILELMKRITDKTRMAVIFITHNLAVVAEICDKVSVMYGGYIVEQGSAEDIFYRPSHPYTRGLLRSMPRVDDETGQRLIPIEGTPINMLEPNPGCPFAPRCDSCMKICVRELPGSSALSESHSARCWLLVPEKASAAVSSGDTASPVHSGPEGGGHD